MSFALLAAEPFAVFMAVFLEIFETHAGCGTNWTLGNFMLVEESARTGYFTVAMGFTERAILFGAVQVVLGLVVKEYFKVHKESAANLAKIAGH